MDNNRKMTETTAKDGNVAAGQIGEVTDAVFEKGREVWKDLSAQGKEAVANAQKSAEDAWHDAQKLVQKHPSKAVGIAFLAGAAIGALLTFSYSD